MAPATPTVRHAPDVWSYWLRGGFYWLVTVVALQAGGYYASRAITIEQCLLLFIPAFALWPFYVIYGKVYDLDRQAPAVGHLPAEQGTSSFRDYVRGSQNDAWVLLVGSVPLLIAVLWLAAGRFPAIDRLYMSLSRWQLGYFALLWVFHGYYARWILVNQARASLLQQVRYETFTPVLIVSFAFFLAATYSLDSFSPLLYTIPLAIFGFYLSLHFWDKRRKIAPTAFAWLSAIFLLAVPLLVLVLARAPGVDPRAAAGWAKTSLVALALGLYLSLFELWRLTAIAGRRAEPTYESARVASYFQATLVSHAISILALPLMFVFGDFGMFFLIAAEIHAILAFGFWYRFGASSDWNIRWRRSLKLVFGFGFFVIIGVDVFLGFWSPVDRYPHGISGLSASLFVAVLFAVLASPFVQYLTDEDRNLSLRELIARFFSLPANPMVFRQAAVLSGGLFIVMNFVYEVVRNTGTVTAAKASYAFWLYALATLVFSVFAFFSGPSGTRSGRAAGGTATTVSTLVGVVQTLRILTGGIIFLGVLLVGLSAGTAMNAAAGMALSVTLVAMGSFGINDYYDHLKDAINHRHRAIPSGRLTPRGALACGLGSLVCGIVIGMRTLEGVGLGLFFLGCLGAAIYNELVRVAPEWKGAVTAFLSGLVVVFDFVAFQLDAEVLWLSASCLLFVLGRELLMDVRDISGDHLFGSWTLATRLGSGASERLGFSIVLLSAVPLLIFLSAAAKGPAAYLLAAAYLASILFAALVWFLGKGNRSQWLAVEVLKLPLLVGIVLMVI